MEILSSAVIPADGSALTQWPFPDSTVDLNQMIFNSDDGGAAQSFFAVDVLMLSSKSEPPSTRLRKFIQALMQFNRIGQGKGETVQAASEADVQFGNKSCLKSQKRCDRWPCFREKTLALTDSLQCCQSGASIGKVSERSLPKFQTHMKNMNRRFT